LRPGAKVLLVEDSRAIATMLTARIDGIDGVACTNGATCADAQSLLREDAGRFFLAVLDLDLPDAPDGEVIDLVGDYGIPIDVSTGNLDEAVRDRLFAHGVADYVVKDCLVGRFRGEEFVSLTAIRKPAEERGCLEAIRQRIAAVDLQHAGEPVQLTVSIGATWSLGAGLDATLRRADLAVFEAKRAGRNRVVVTWIIRRLKHSAASSDAVGGD
jgi:CheY-like chemotaxis protein